MINQALRAPMSDGRFLKSDDLMQTLGYTDRSAFWKAVRSAGIPHTRINARKILFEQVAVNDWLHRRTVGFPNIHAGRS